MVTRRPLAHALPVSLIAHGWFQTAHIIHIGGDVSRACLWCPLGVSYVFELILHFSVGP